LIDDADRVKPREGDFPFVARRERMAKALGAAPDALAAWTLRTSPN